MTSPAARRKQPSSSVARARPLRPKRTAKLSITVDAEVLRDVERVVRQTGSTLSAHVSAALARDLRMRRLRELIHEYETEEGTISDEELERARAEWLG